MKIKAVESLLKQTKFITLYDDDRCQWVSNGHACYPLRNMPLLDADSIFTMLDVPEEKKDKYIFRRDELSASGLDFSDNVTAERVFDRDLLALSMGGKEIEALRSHSGGILFFDTAFLKPFADEESVELYERQDERRLMKYLFFQLGEWIFEGLAILATIVGGLRVVGWIVGLLCDNLSIGAGIAVIFLIAFIEIFRGR